MVIVRIRLTPGHRRSATTARPRTASAVVLGAALFTFTLGGAACGSRGEEVVVHTYYVVRANALENNVVLYQVEGGRRTDLAVKGEGRTYGKKATVPSGAWSTLAIRARGSLVEVVYNRTKLYEVEDGTFTGPWRRVGVWTKAVTPLVPRPPPACRCGSGSRSRALKRPRRSRARRAGQPGWPGSPVVLGDSRPRLSLGPTAR